jgi:hypothetical protein
MNSLLKMAPILLLLAAASSNLMASTLVSVEITNKTLGTLKLKQASGLERELGRPLTAFNIGPGTTEIIDLDYARAFTYDAPGWQPTKKKVAPINLAIDYEIHGYRCRMQTSLDVAVVPGALEPSYKPRWKHTSTASGNNNYRCHSSITTTLSKPPYSYTVNFTIEK